MKIMDLMMRTMIIMMILYHVEDVEPDDADMEEWRHGRGGFWWSHSCPCGPLVSDDGDDDDDDDNVNDNDDDDDDDDDDGDDDDDANYQGRNIWCKSSRVRRHCFPTL